MKRKLLLIGGGGHCRSVLDTVLENNDFDEIAIIDNDLSINGVIGCDDDLPELLKKGWRNALITVGSVGDTSLRRKLYLLAKEIGFDFPTIVDNTAVVSKKAVVGEGTFIGKRAVVNSSAIIGKCCIINTGAIIEHDCKLDDFVHFATGSVACGEVNVGENSHIGAGSVIRQQTTIGKDCLIGAGSTVVSDIPDGSVAYGNPCKVK